MLMLKRNQLKKLAMFFSFGFLRSNWSAPSAGIEPLIPPPPNPTKQTRCRTGEPLRRGCRLAQYRDQAGGVCSGNEL